MSNKETFKKLKELHRKLHLNKGLFDVVTSNECFKEHANKYVPLRGEIKEPTGTTLLEAVQKNHNGRGAKFIPHKIFVGNLSYKLTSSQLKTFFLSFGHVLHAQIIKERVKRRSKGYGFVTFSQASEVRKVLQASEEELILDGRVLRVNRAEKRRRGIDSVTNDSNMGTSLQDCLRNYEKSNADLEGRLLITDEKDVTCKLSEDQHGICAITCLNDDTLLHIFSFLSIKERITVERVCHRWRYLARQSWLTVTHLDFQGIFRSFQGTGGLTDAILLSLFRRGCRNLQSLDLSHSPRLLTDYSLYLIGHHCSNELEELDLTGVNVTTRSLKDLSSNCSKLKSIRLQQCYDVGEKALWWLFKQCQQLQYIDVGGNTRITGQCFFMLTEKCKYLIVNKCLKLGDIGMELLVKRCPNLSELNISNCPCLTDIGVSTLFQHCCNLRRLIFCKPSKDVSLHSLMSIKNLHYLEELHLAQQYAVDDDVLFVIAHNCATLRTINLEACHNVTNTGVQHLASCLHLQKIIISYLDQVTDTAIEFIAYLGILRVFHARCCFNITDQAIEKLALHCPNLSELDLCGSDGISDTALLLLHKYLGDQENMTVVVGGTGITQEKAQVLQQNHPNWNITTHNLSDHHLRVDYDPYMDMGRFLPDDDDDEEAFDINHQDNIAEDYLISDDPSMWEYEAQWMS